MLEIEDLEVGYGDAEVVQSFAIRVFEGEIVALIGANGAGKTTALRAISGLQPITRGQIVFEAQTIGGLPAHQITRLGIAHVPEGRHVFPGMTVEDNLRTGGHLLRHKQAIAAGVERSYALFPRLAERRKQMAGTLSGGEQQMLALGRAIMISPKLLLLDEPSLGLAPKIVEEVFDAVVNFRRAGMSVLLVEQNARLALEIADRAYVIELGRIALEGSSAEMLANPAVGQSYLGIGGTH